MRVRLRPAPLLAALLLLAIAAVAAIAASAADAATTANAGQARPLALFARELPSDSTEQARQALERDARRRELRFLNAAEPGLLFRATRVEQDDIDRGRWGIGDLFEMGAQIFHLSFTPEMGLGDGDRPGLSRVHRGRRGGPDERSCAHCHWRGGPAGAGDAVNNAYLDGDGETQASALARNPPPLHGAGLLEILAAEMSAELAAIREQAGDDARHNETPVRVRLEAKGVPFGFISAHPDGRIDTGEVEGVDADLVIKPLGWKGTYATLRQVVEDELAVHHGMQSTHFAATAPAERSGSHGAPDADGDSIVDEITEGQVTALTLYLALQEVPEVELPRSDLVPVSDWAAGRRQFESLGCAICHRPSLPLSSTVYRLHGRNGSPELAVDLAREGAEPRITPSIQGGDISLDLFSDLKRHDLGPDMAEARDDRGVGARLFLTRPLWGLARSRPYLHDGSAPTLEDAILRHGGEAREARDRFAALSEPERAPLRIFLTTLTRARRMVSP